MSAHDMKANNSQDKALNITWLETRRCGVHVSGGGAKTYVACVLRMKVQHSEPRLIATGRAASLVSYLEGKLENTRAGGAGK